MPKLEDLEPETIIEDLLDRAYKIASEEDVTDLLAAIIYIRETEAKNMR